jgi:hypothetical protein
MCEEHDRLRADALAAFAEAKRIRRGRDISFEEDAQLTREAYRRTDALLRHLLVGHDGEPCPAGDTYRKYYRVEVVKDEWWL